MRYLILILVMSTGLVTANPLYTLLASSGTSVTMRQVRTDGYTWSASEQQKSCFTGWELIDGQWKFFSTGTQPVVATTNFDCRAFDYESEISLISDGVDDYINTLHAVTENTSIYVKGALLTVGDVVFMGSSWAEYFYMGSSGSLWRFAYGTTGVKDIISVDTSVHEFELTKAGLVYLDGVMTWDFGAVSRATRTQPMFIGCRNLVASPSKFANFEFLSVKVYEDDILVMELVPVKGGTAYNSDGLTAPSNCLYDKISKTFFENQGTGEFGITGNYKYLQHIYYNGLCELQKRGRITYAIVSDGVDDYVDTGIYPNNNTRIVFHNQTAVAKSGDSYTFGCNDGLQHRYYIGVKSNSEYGIGYGTVSINNYGVYAGDSRIKSKVEMNQNEIYIDDVKVLDNTGTYTGVSELSMWIFGVNDAQLYAETEVGEIYIYVDNILVQHLIPVPKNSTQFTQRPAPSNCFWDTVTRQYFENQGTGDFGLETYGQ